MVELDCLGWSQCLSFLWYFNTIGWMVTVLQQVQFENKWWKGVEVELANVGLPGVGR